MGAGAGFSIDLSADRGSALLRQLIQAISGMGPIKSENGNQAANITANSTLPIGYLLNV
jgi:hypothetical protein